MASSSTILLLCALLCTESVLGLHLSPRGYQSSKTLASDNIDTRSVTRRDIFNLALATTGALTAVTPALAETTESDVDVYFGIGCFWHVQHEFIEAERAILGRADDQLTALAGFAGGSRVGKNANRPDQKGGLVCYHNMQGVADYGKLGHGEVVGMHLPPSKVAAFADVYFGLFGKDGDRPDKGDRGPEYRSLLGMPGGTASPLYAAVAEAAERRGVGLTLSAGGGDDPDTLGKKNVWVMDSTKFPFYQAEVYHQYHDGFMPGEDYPKAYNNMQTSQYQAGRLNPTGCPDVV